MNRKRTAARALTLVAALGAVFVVSARPNRYGHSDREERHMLPAVSSGPLDPAWSPDGRWIAFSMRGDIWKVPADGGEAIAVTSGPAYHFEPAWSPDGTRIAFSYQATGNLEIGIVSADGGPEETIASHPARRHPAGVEPRRQEPVLHRARAPAVGGSSATTSRPTQRHADRERHPAGGVARRQALAYEQSGLRVLDLATGQSTLVRDEETEYRMEPAWTPDGQNILYVTEDEGSNDIRIIPAAGGDPIELTFDATRHEMSPAVSPDGTRFAFVQFAAGVPTLYTADIAGGRRASWRKVPITSRRPRDADRPCAHSRASAPTASPMPARIYVDASDGRHYTPDDAVSSVDDGVRPPLLPHARRRAELEVPAGRTTHRGDARLGVRADRPSTVDVTAGGDADRDDSASSG